MIEGDETGRVGRARVEISSGEVMAMKAGSNRNEEDRGEVG